MQSATSSTLTSANGGNGESAGGSRLRFGEGAGTSAKCARAGGCSSSELLPSDPAGAGTVLRALALVRLLAACTDRETLRRKPTLSLLLEDDGSVLARAAPGDAGLRPGARRALTPSPGTRAGMPSSSGAAASSAAACRRGARESVTQTRRTTSASLGSK